VNIFFMKKKTLQTVMIALINDRQLKRAPIRHHEPGKSQQGKILAVGLVVHDTCPGALSAA
jgi:hypothetical protein